VHKTQPVGVQSLPRQTLYRLAAIDRIPGKRVAYVGQVPDLFREGQGVVAEGVLVGPGQFRADSVLAKHDEKYMPREVADALKKQGVWNDGAPAPAASK
jgi:cytochrome c-type biogenesis protein CcmE